MTSKEIPKRLDQLLKEKGMTLYELIAKSGIADATCYNTYSGKSIPRVDSLERMCDGLGITLNEFFNPDVELENVRNYTLKERELLEVCEGLNPHIIDRVISYIEGIKDK